ncbi:hypothetical protein [Celeribacter sp.]|uniref:hypothetical protein n=1 Tax=Celeribacter sp. TaxID=1890673 RepID=UPI003A8D6985
MASCGLAAPAWAQGAVPLFFVDAPGAQTFSISFTERQFNADEVWFVTGTCRDTPDPAPVYVTPLELDAELKVFLSRYRFTAVRSVCIVNQEAAPPAFWAAYEKTQEQK